MINWRVRARNKTFWITLIPALIVVIQAVGSVFGYTIDLSAMSGKLVAVVDAVFCVLTILGVVVDPTTKGVEDSEQAKGYDEPK